MNAAANGFRRPDQSKWVRKIFGPGVKSEPGAIAETEHDSDTGRSDDDNDDDDDDDGDDSITPLLITRNNSTIRSHACHIILPSNLFSHNPRLIIQIRFNHI